MGASLSDIEPRNARTSNGGIKVAGIMACTSMCLALATASIVGTGKILAAAAFPIAIFAGIGTAIIYYGFIKPAEEYKKQDAIIGDAVDMEIKNIEKMENESKHSDDKVLSASKEVNLRKENQSKESLSNLESAINFESVPISLFRQVQSDNLDSSDQILTTLNENR